MPTAAKLVAAVLFAAFGWIGANYFIPSLPEATPIGMLRESAALIGALCGWMIMGRVAGRGYSTSIGNGISTSVAIAFWLVLFWAGYEMVVRSTKMMYDGPMDAVLGVVDLMVQYGRLMLTPEVLGTMLIGGVVTGLFAEWAARRWS
ncbi:MAG: TrgA family protein [Paracoccaceae bacterium]